MKFSLINYGRFLSFKKVPGSLWAGKQRKIPLLTNRRKESMLNDMLIHDQNLKILNMPYLLKEVESTYLELIEKPREQKRIDDMIFKNYIRSFNNGHPTTTLDKFWNCLKKSKNYES